MTHHKKNTGNVLLYFYLHNPKLENIINLYFIEDKKAEKNICVPNYVFENVFQNNSCIGTIIESDSSA